MDSPPRSGPRDSPPALEIQPSASYSMEDPSVYSFSGAPYSHSAYADVAPQQYWLQAQLPPQHTAVRARTDRAYVTEDQRRELEMQFALANQYSAYGSSVQSLTDLFHPAPGLQLPPRLPLSSGHAPPFQASPYAEMGQSDATVPYVPAGYYPTQLQSTLLPFGVPAYANYGPNPYLSLPSQPRATDDDGASVDAPTPESTAHVDNWLQAGPFPPLHEEPNALLHEPPQASTSSNASSDLQIPSVPGPSRSSPSLPPARPGARKNKRYIVQREVSCQICTDLIGTLLLRGTREELDVRHELVYECSKHGSSPPPSVTGRKRTRQPEDIRLACVCDVCGRTRGRGGIIPKDQGQAIGFAVEVVCKSCFQKYQRCSDCGGGSGRVMVGKWRCKEVFEKGRKTCKLPHARLSGGEVELGTWRLDELKSHSDFDEVFGQCRKLWEDRVLGKLGIPEFLEHEIEENSRAYDDLAGILERGYPLEKTLDHKFDQGRPHRRYVTFVWQHLRSRREKQASTPTPTRSPSEESGDPGSVLAPNIRRTLDFNVKGATIISMYLVDWDMRTGTLLLNTSLALDGNDIDDKAVAALGEMIPLMLAEREKYNKENPAQPIPSPRHVWNTFHSSSSLVNARWTDLMTKRGFVNLDEYLTIHTDVGRQDFAPPAYGHPWQDDPDWRPLQPMKSTAITMCKFIAEDLDPVMLERLRQIEMSKKPGRRKRSA